VYHFLFWRKGYLGTSLTDLTEAMGINRPSLYAAFGNKETNLGSSLAEPGAYSLHLLAPLGVEQRCH
jgi:AcrR family transcriptional regulator